MTADGIKSLKRGIPSQYRIGARFVANSSTYGIVERLKDGEGRYLFDDLTENDRLLMRTASESEVMPDVAANTFPMLFMHMVGYYIVERSGMTVERMMDSNTGPNKVEFHTRRRVGGRMVKTWLAAVQKVAAS
jgi:HK97 family phage major capsid protein